MRQTYAHPTTGGNLLIAAVLAAGAAGLAADAPEARAEPSSTAMCGRGVNLGFESPTVPGMGSPQFTDYPHSDDVPGWDTTNENSRISIMASGTHPDVLSSPDNSQYAELSAEPAETLSQPFPTLSGDVIAWTAQHAAPRLEIVEGVGERRRVYKGAAVDVLFGAPANPTAVQRMTSSIAKVWTSYSGLHTVGHTGEETVLSLKGIDELDPDADGALLSFVDGVKLDLTCSISITGRITGHTDNDDSGTVTAGDAIELAYEVRNTAAADEGNRVGAASLTNLVVTDSLGSTADCPSDKETLLKPSESMTCTTRDTLTANDVSRGTVTVTVKADDAAKAKEREDNSRVAPSVQAEATVDWSPSFTVADKGTTVNKAAVSPAKRVDKDDKVSYKFLVTNTGDPALASIAVNDRDATVVCPNMPLARGASTTCTVTVSLTQPQIDAGSWSVKETITVSTSYGLSATQAHTATATLAPAPAVSLDSTAAVKAPVKAGSKVSYSFKATNTGNVTLTGLSVRDPKAGEATCPTKTLAPNASTTCTAVYTATAADITAGAIKSTAKVTAQAPNKKTVTATDSALVSFAAERLDGKDRYSTAVAISKATFAPGVETAYIATGVNFPDALAGSAASGGDGPILLVAKDSIPGATLTELRRLKPKKIIVLGGTGVVSTAVESTLRKEATTTRQAGADRYSTAAAISAKHFDPGTPVAFIATGEDFPDASAGGPIAAKLGGPILLTRKDKLPSTTIKELGRLKPKHIIVLGGTGVVSLTVEKALQSYTVGKVSRLAGPDRYWTAREISRDQYGPGVPVVYIATGLNYPDALVGGVAGASKDGPLLFVTMRIPKATKDELTRLKPKRIVVLGGTGVVPKTVRDALGAYLPKTP